MNSFSYLVAMPLELIVAGMSWQEHLKVRLVALVLNTLVGRPYGLWRHYVIQRTHTCADSHWFKKYWVDTLTFLSFQLPLYVANMIIGGASVMGIIKAGVSATILSGFLGRPYGLYSDAFRRLIGLRAELQGEK